MKMTVHVTEKRLSTQVNKIKITALSVLGLVLAAAAVALAIVDPIFVVARKSTRISQGSPIFELLKKKINGVHVQAYLFNVTNSERFLAGLDHKLKVEEVGPFTYMETRVNEDLELDEAAGVLRYTPKTSVTFMPELSIADPKDVRVVMPNVAFLSIAAMLSSKSFIVKLAFSMTARRLKVKPIVSMDAHSYLWGYEDPLIQFGHSLAPGLVNFNKMGIMDRMYDPTVSNRLEVSSRDEDKFIIHTVNGDKGMPEWNYNTQDKRSRCNTFVNTYEGIGYPPGITPDQEIRVWRHLTCRIIEMDYVGEKTLDYGVPAHKYTISNRTYDYNPDKECLCTKEECINGISDLSACFMGMPLAISNAHFLGGEPRLFARVEGLSPDEEKHGSEMLVEPNTGFVVSTHLTMQTNILIEDVNFNDAAAPFSNMVVPIAYFKIIQPELPQLTIDKLKLMSNVFPKVFLAAETIMFLVGVFLLSYCLRKIFWNAVLCGEIRGMAFTVPNDEKLTPSQILPLMENDKS